MIYKQDEAAVNVITVCETQKKRARPEPPVGNAGGLRRAQGTPPPPNIHGSRRSAAGKGGRRVSVVVVAGPCGPRLQVTGPWRCAAS